MTTLKISEGNNKEFFFITKNGFLMHQKDKLFCFIDGGGYCHWLTFEENNKLKHKLRPVQNRTLEHYKDIAYSFFGTY